MKLQEMLTALRAELRDTGAIWSDSELNRCIQKAVCDVDRFFPLEACKEITFIPSVTDEVWTAADAAGTWVQLQNKPISWNSETVKNSAGAVCARDTDYYMDYIHGRITHIAGGKISNGETCIISYDKSKVAVDLSTLNIIRIQRVEYPYGNVPQSFSSYDFFDGKLWLTGVEVDQQSKLTSGKHIVVFYYTQNICPTAEEDGSFPRHLDEVVVKGASAYACFIKALQYEHQAADNLSSAATALSKISHTKAETALDAAATALSSARTALGKVETYLIGTSAPSAARYLDDGDAYINQVTVGADVAARYADFAARSSELAVALIREASEYNTTGSNYAVEAGTRLAQIDRYVREAETYITIATQSLQLAERFRTEGSERRAEFLGILSDRAQLSGRAVASVSPRQVRT